MVTESESGLGKAWAVAHALGFRIFPTGEFATPSYFLFFPKKTFLCVRTEWKKVVSDRFLSSASLTKCFLDMTPIIYQKASSCIRLITAVLLLFFFPFFTILGGEDSKSGNAIKFYGDERIWFVPGWRASDQIVGKYEENIEDVYKSPVYVFTWDSNKSWDESKRNAVRAAEDLARKILSLSDEQKKELILIGHSLGARVIAKAMKEISNKNIKLQKIVFLGAALDYDAEEIEYVNKVSMESPINVFSRDDGVLKYAYGNMEKKASCGCYGISGSNRFTQYSLSIDNKNGIEVDENGIVQRLYETIHSLEVHYVENYCSFLKKIENKDNQIKPVGTIDLDIMYKQLNLIARDSQITMPFKTLYIPLITVEEEKDGWQFGKTVKSYAINDPLERLVSTSLGGKNEEILRKEWARIKEQLKKEKQ